MVITLLYHLTEWHTLAKLCMHMEATVTHLENITKMLDSKFCHFWKHTCSAFLTVELPKKVAAQAQSKQRHNSVGNQPAAATTKSAQPSRMISKLTYKLHALGDYCHTIHKHGATDLYSIQLVGTIFICHSYIKLGFILDIA